jgi:hypothetical protein
MFFKRTIPLLIVLCLGLLGFLQDYVPHPASASLMDEMATWSLILSGFAALLGLYSLLHMHFSRIRRQLPGWGYSVFVFLGAVGMMAVGFFSDSIGTFTTQAGKVDLYDWGYNYVYIPCAATVFSFLAFYMASAAFRTFRARNLAAGLLLVAAIIVMFGRVPLSETVSEWAFGNRQTIPGISEAIMDYPNMAAKRGILLGIALGLISQSLRIVFGVERSYLGGGE